MGDETRCGEKIIAGLKEAVAHARGEDTGARVTTYRIGTPLRPNRRANLKRAREAVSVCLFVHDNSELLAVNRVAAALAEQFEDGVRYGLRVARDME